MNNNLIEDVLLYENDSHIIVNKYQFNSLGYLIEKTNYYNDKIMSKYSYKYNEQGFVIEEIVDNIAGGAYNTLHYVYDTNSNISQMEVFNVSNVRDLLRKYEYLNE